MIKIRILLQTSLILFSIFAVNKTWAVCKYAGDTLAYRLPGQQFLETDDGSAAKIRFGTVQLMDEVVQPPGTTMAKIMVAPTEFKARNTVADSILYQCDSSDLNDITFLVATNGDDASGGMYEVPGADSGGQAGVFYTYYRRVGLRLAMDGIVINKYWQEVPVKNYDLGQGNNGCPSGKICIRLKHIPNLQAELIRIRSCTTTAGQHCLVEPAQNQYYTYVGPAAYIQLSNKSATGNQPVGFGHDKVGDDSQTKYLFWGNDNGFGYTLWNALRIINESNNSCVLTSNTPVVTFPNTTTQVLNANGQVSADFNLQIECKNGFIAGTSQNQNAFGIQVNQSSYTLAQTLGLVNASNGVMALVSDDYNTNSDRAKNVGVFLVNPANNNPMNFIGQPGLTGNFAETGGTGCTGSTTICYPKITYPSGNAAGWYTVSQNATSLGSSHSGNTQYNIPMRALLKKLSSASSVTAGSVNATATVLVKIQ